MSSQERQYKRSNLRDHASYTVAPFTSDSNDMSSHYGPNSDSPLVSVAMRIRKAVSEGYNNGQLNFSGNFQRCPLPNNMSSPPMLFSSESTRTVSNLEEWDSYYKINNAPVQTLDANGGNYYDQSQNALKRKFNDFNEQQEPEIALYQAKYGALHFNEEF